MRATLAVAAGLAVLLSACSSGSGHPSSAASAPPSVTSSSPTPGAAPGSPAASSPGTSSPGTSSPGPSTAPVELPSAPRVGACYRLTFADATRPTSQRPAVPCTRPHTAVTMYVGRLDLVVDGHALGVDSDRAQRQVASTCTAKLPAYLGGTVQARQLSRFQVTWFSPTLRQSDAGADWFRCDLVAVGTGEQLMQLPARDLLRHVLDRPAALATYGLCGTTRPGAAGFRRVPCAARHSWAAISTIPLAGGARYPGTAVVRSAGDQTCADLVRRRSGLPLRFEYGWEWPTQAQWSAGQHYGYCWAPST